MYLLYSSEGVLERKTKGAAGFDLSATETVTIPVGGSAIVPTGMKVAIPQDMFGLITMRSGHGFKQGLICHIGIIDSDFRGEIKVKVFNLGIKAVCIEKGERFAQLTPISSPCITAFNVKELPTTERGDGGYGSTGV